MAHTEGRNWPVAKDEARGNMARQMARGDKKDKINYWIRTTGNS